MGLVGIRGEVQKVDCHIEAGLRSVGGGGYFWCF